MNLQDPGNERSRFSQVDTLDPLYLHPSDNPCIALVSKCFDGVGFGTWKRSMLIGLSTKNNICFVRGTQEVPNPESPEHRIWERCNGMIVSWILNALSKDIAERVVRT